MTYIILSNLQIIFFFIYFVIKNFKKIFMHYFAIGNIIIYYIIKISNILNKVANYIKFMIYKK